MGKFRCGPGGISEISTDRFREQKGGGTSMKKGTKLVKLTANTRELDHQVEDKKILRERQREPRLENIFNY